MKGAIMWKKGLKVDGFRDQDPIIKFNISNDIWDHVPHGRERLSIPYPKRFLWDWFYKDEYSHVTIKHEVALETLNTWKKANISEKENIVHDKEKTLSSLNNEKKNIKKICIPISSIFAAITLISLGMIISQPLGNLNEIKIINNLMILVTVLMLVLTVISILVLLFLLVNNKIYLARANNYYDNALIIINQESISIDDELSDLNQKRYHLITQIPQIPSFHKVEEYLFQNIYAISRYYLLKMGMIKPHDSEYHKIINLEIDTSLTKEYIIQNLPYYIITPSILSNKNLFLYHSINDSSRHKKHIKAYQIGTTINDIRYITYKYQNIPIFSFNTITLFISNNDKIIICQFDLDILDNIDIYKSKIYNEYISIHLKNNIEGIVTHSITDNISLSKIMNIKSLKDRYLLNNFEINYKNQNHFKIRFPSKEVISKLTNPNHSNNRSITYEIDKLINEINKEKSNQSKLIYVISNNYDNEVERDKHIKKLLKTYNNLIDLQKKKALLEISYAKIYNSKVEKNIHHDLAKAIKNYLQSSYNNDPTFNLEQIMKNILESGMYQNNENIKSTSIDKADIFEAFRIIDQINIKKENNSHEDEYEVWS